MQEDRRIHLFEGEATIAQLAQAVAVRVFGSGTDSSKLYRAGKGDRMLSSWRELGRIVFGKRRVGHNHHNKRGAAELARATDCVLEGLENRQLLTITLPGTPAVLPAPNVTDHVDISGGDQNTRHNTASVAYNPLNPSELVSVWSMRDDRSNPQKLFVEGGYSTDGGVTWTNFAIPGNLRNPLMPDTNPQIYSRATDPAAAFDRLGNFYVTYLEHTDDQASGAVVLQGYDFTGNSPNQTVTDTIIYQWPNADAAQTPMIAVDNNFDTFTDPETG